MTVGQLKAILARANATDETPVYLAVIDDTRDGSTEVGVWQVEVGDGAVTVYVEPRYEGQICVVDL